MVHGRTAGYMGGNAVSAPRSASLHVRRVFPNGDSSFLGIPMLFSRKLAVGSFVKMAPIQASTSFPRVANAALSLSLRRMGLPRVASPCAKESVR